MDPFADEPVPAVNRLAVASLVLGAGWFFWIGSALALALGAVARRQIAESEGAQSGNGMANAGIVLGLVGALVFLGVAVALVYYGVMPDGVPEE